MSTLRVSNIEAKADVSSPSVHEKVKVTNSQGDVLIHIDGSTSGITTVGINTTGSSFDIDINQNVTFAGNVTVGGTLTYADVTNVDSIGFVTARSGLNVGTDSAIRNFTDGGETKFIEIGATGGGSGGDALLVTHSSGSGVGYFGYEAGGDRLVIATDGGSGTNKIDFITDAGTATGGGTDNLNGKVPKMRIMHDGNTGINQSNPNKAKLHVVSNGSNLEEIVAKFRNPYSTAGNSVAKIGFVAGYSDTANDNEGHAYIGALREGNGNTTSLVFQTSSGSSVAEQFKISSNGHVTAPNQPAFFAHFVGTDTTVNNGSVIVWSSTRFNRGSHYSTSTGKFTAPVAGVYCFQAQIWAKNSGTNHSRAQFHKNGTGRSQNGFHYGTVNSTVDHAFEMTILEDMQVGDEMDIRPDNANLTFYAGNTNTVHSYFTGFLVG